MLKEDLDKLKYISMVDINQAGALINGIDFNAISRVNDLRAKVKLPVYFMLNGINTGKHRSLGHPKGRAFDIHFGKKLTGVEAVKVALLASSVGFNVIGVYFNSNDYYSFHVELDPSDKAMGLKTWYATKGDNNKWVYSPLTF